MAGSGVLASRAHVVDTRRALMPARLAARRISVPEKLAPWRPNWWRSCSGSAGMLRNRSSITRQARPVSIPAAPLVADAISLSACGLGTPSVATWLTDDIAESPNGGLEQPAHQSKAYCPAPPRQRRRDTWGSWELRPARETRPFPPARRGQSRAGIIAAARGSAMPSPHTPSPMVTLYLEH